MTSRRDSRLARLASPLGLRRVSQRDGEIIAKKVTGSAGAEWSYQVRFRGHEWKGDWVEKEDDVEAYEDLKRRFWKPWSAPEVKIVAAKAKVDDILDQRGKVWGPSAAQFLPQEDVAEVSVDDGVGDGVGDGGDADAGDDDDLFGDREEEAADDPAQRHEEYIASRFVQGEPGPFFAGKTASSVLLHPRRPRAVSPTGLALQPSPKRRRRSPISKAKMDTVRIDVRNNPAALSKLTLLTSDKRFGLATIRRPVGGMRDRGVSTAYGASVERIVQETVVVSHPAEPSRSSSVQSSHVSSRIISSEDLSDFEEDEVDTVTTHEPQSPPLHQPVASRRDPSLLPSSRSSSAFEVSSYSKRFYEDLKLRLNLSSQGPAVPLTLSNWVKDRTSGSSKPLIDLERLFHQFSERGNESNVPMVWSLRHWKTTVQKEMVAQGDAYTRQRCHLTLHFSTSTLVDADAYHALVEWLAISENVLVLSPRERKREPFWGSILILSSFSKEFALETGFLESDLVVDLFRTGASQVLRRGRLLMGHCEWDPSDILSRAKNEGGEISGDRGVRLQFKEIVTKVAEEEPL